jgi:hypothetical protein
MQLNKYTSSIQNLNIYTLINQIIGSSEQQQTEPGANGEWNTAKVTVNNLIVAHTGSEEPLLVEKRPSTSVAE